MFLHLIRCPARPQETIRKVEMLCISLYATIKRARSAALERVLHVPFLKVHNVIRHRPLVECLYSSVPGSTPALAGAEVADSAGCTLAEERWN